MESSFQDNVPLIPLLQTFPFLSVLTSVLYQFIEVSFRGPFSTHENTDYLGPSVLSIELQAQLIILADFTPCQWVWSRLMLSCEQSSAKPPILFKTKTDCLDLKILSRLRQIPSPERQRHSPSISVPVSRWYPPPPLILGSVVGGWRRANGLLQVLNLFFTLLRLYLLVFWCC